MKALVSPANIINRLPIATQRVNLCGCMRFCSVLFVIVAFIFDPVYPIGALLSNQLNITTGKYK